MKWGWEQDSNLIVTQKYAVEVGNIYHLYISFVAVRNQWSAFSVLFTIKYHPQAAGQVLYKIEVLGFSDV